MKADLHMHSTYSDGSLSVEELWNEINKASLDVIALTDHDTLRGVKEMIELSKKYGVRVIPGLELSTYSNGESIHILGYFKSYESISKEFIEYLDGMEEKRYYRLKKMTEMANERWGFNIDFDRIRKEHPYMLERPHLADAIGEVTGLTRKEVFEKYIGNDSPIYIPATKISVEDGIKLIHDAGGIAVLAHPYCYKKNDHFELIDKGVDGVEVFYGPYDKKNYPKYKEYAESHNLIMTGGSDFHTFMDSKHSNIGTAVFISPYVEMFLARINSLK